MADHVRESNQKFERLLGELGTGGFMLIYVKLKINRTTVERDDVKRQRGYRSDVSLTRSHELINYIRCYRHII